MPARSSAPARPKIVCVVGQTATGKSDLAVELALRFSGEVISCDSRQIYRGLDLGTGKVPGRWRVVSNRRVFVYRGVPHHCIDYVSPRRQYSAAAFQTDAARAIAGILGRGKLPILCGGTGHWAEAVALGQRLPEVAPQPALRASLEHQTTEQLFTDLKRRDPGRARTVDPRNRRRLIRALEIVLVSGEPVPARTESRPYDVLWLAPKFPKAVLDSRIAKRLDRRLKAGMVGEVRRLHGRGLSYRRLDELGLEYRFIGRYLQGLSTREEMRAALLAAIRQYAKRQLTWFKKNGNIRWVLSLAQTQRLVARFLEEP